MQNQKEDGESHEEISFSIDEDELAKYAEEDESEPKIEVSRLSAKELASGKRNKTKFEKVEDLVDVGLDSEAQEKKDMEELQ